MSRPRCPRCQRPLTLCLCPLIPALESRTRVLVLQHSSEASHALNTARLAVLGLRNAQLRIGERFADESSSDELTCVLFPGEEAVPISTFADADRPVRLIVPDGTWRKARKILHVNPWLAGLPRVSLPDGLSSRYRLRKAPMPGALSTIEAIVAALDILEGANRFDELLRPFDALIDGQIDAMGQDVYCRNHADADPAH